MASWGHTPKVSDSVWHLFPASELSLSFPGGVTASWCAFSGPGLHPPTAFTCSLGGHFQSPPLPPFLSRLTYAFLCPRFLGLAGDVSVAPSSQLADGQTDPSPAAGVPPWLLPSSPFIWILPPSQPAFPQPLGPEISAGCLFPRQGDALQSSSPWTVVATPLTMPPGSVSCPPPQASSAQRSPLPWPAL